MKEKTVKTIQKAPERTRSDSKLNNNRSETKKASTAGAGGMRATQRVKAKNSTSVMKNSDKTQRGSVANLRNSGQKRFIPGVGEKTEQKRRERRGLKGVLVVIATILVVIGVSLAGMMLSSRGSVDDESIEEEITEVEPEPEPDPTLDYPKTNPDPLVPEPVIDDPELYEVAPYKPRYMSIPSIGMIKIPVVEFGVSQSQLGAPINVRLMGWWYQSAFPGQPGVSVMDGHGGDLGIGILKELPKAQVGDQIIVEMGDGRKIVYKIKQMIYKQLGTEANDFMNTALFESPEPGVPAMTVITCTGTWLPAMQTYDKRLFVRALLTDEEPVGLEEGDVDVDAAESADD